MQEDITAQTGPSNFGTVTACWHRASAASGAEGASTDPCGAPHGWTPAAPPVPSLPQNNERCCVIFPLALSAPKKTLEKPSFPEEPSKINRLLSLVPLQIPSPVLYKLYAL